MQKKKRFDAVELKWEIQRRLVAEYPGMTAEQARDLQRRRIDEDPVLGPFLVRVSKTLGVLTRTEQR